MKKSLNKLEEKTLLYVVKKTMQVYQLRKMTVSGDKVVADELVHEDVPSIVYGKFVQGMVNSGFSPS